MIIEIDGIGDVPVPAGFDSWDEARQDAWVDSYIERNSADLIAAESSPESGFKPTLTQKKETLIETKDKLIDKTEEIKEKGTEGFFKFLDKILNPSAPVVDNIQGGVAFVYSLFDGYSFGLLDYVVSDVLGVDAIKRIKEEHPTAATAGDIVSFLSPQAAAKIWVALGRVGAKQVARAIAKKGAKTTIEDSEKAYKVFMNTLKKAKKAGTKVTTNQLIADAAGIPVKEFDKIAKKYGLKSEIKSSALQIGYRGITAFKGKLGDVLNKFKAAAKVDRNISKGLSFASRHGIEPVDIVQVFVVYNAVKNSFINQGYPEQEATDNAWGAALALTLGKGVRSQILDRLSGHFKQAIKSKGIFAGLYKTALEFGIGGLVYNIGSLQEAVDEGKEALGYSLGGFVKPKSLIAGARDKASAMKMVKETPMMGNSPMNSLIGSPNNIQARNSLISV